MGSIITTSTKKLPQKRLSDTHGKKRVIVKEKAMNTMIVIKNAQFAFLLFILILLPFLTPF